MDKNIRFRGLSKPNKITIKNLNFAKSGFIRKISAETVS
jgi:hypothetical protein